MGKKHDVDDAHLFHILPKTPEPPDCSVILARLCWLSLSDARFWAVKLANFAAPEDWGNMLVSILATL